MIFTVLQSDVGYTLGAVVAALLTAAAAVFYDRKFLGLIESRQDALAAHVRELEAEVYARRCESARANARLDQIADLGLVDALQKLAALEAQVEHMKGRDDDQEQEDESDG